MEGATARLRTPEELALQNTKSRTLMIRSSFDEKVLPDRIVLGTPASLFCCVLEVENNLLRNVCGNAIR